MEHETITLSDSFEQGIRDEGLVESLGNAIARHNAAATKLDKTTPEGKAQLESMAALADVQRHLRRCRHQLSFSPYPTSASR